MVSLGGLMVLQLAYLIFVWIPAGNDWALEQASTHAEDHLQTLGDSLVPQLLSSQPAAVSETLEYVQNRQPHWHGLKLENTAGIQVYPPRGQRPQDCAGCVPVSHEIVHDGGLLGTLSLQLDVGGLSAGYLRQTRLLGVVMSLVALVAMVLVGLIVEFLVLRPGKGLQQAAASLAMGDYLTETPRGGSYEIRQLIDTFTDMRAEIRRSQEHLRQARDEAESASRSKSLFLATMSHEIRTPLNGIIAVAHMMKKMPLERKQAEFLGTILRSANHLLAVISDILDFAKIEAGKLDLAPVAMRPGELFAEMNQLLLPLAEARGIAFDQVCGAPADLVVYGDADRLGQVLLNLCTNAIKFTEEGSVTVSCTAKEVTDEGATLVCSVRDTGIGMSSQVLNRVLERFIQGEATYARRFGGTGLGLSISKQIVALMGGALEVDSVEGEGSEFRFEVRLPVVEVQAPASKPVQLCPMVTEMPSLASGLPLRVLVAEDDQITQSIIDNILKMADHEGILARNGQEALDACENEAFDVVLMDVHMPQMDGLEATRRIRALGGLYSDLPIIGLTANASNESRQECLAAGMSHYLTKPMDPDDLIELLDEIHQEVVPI